MKIKSTKQGDIPIFYDSELPAMASCCPQAECGYSIYRGILVRWDEDHDERILQLIDEMPTAVSEQLLVAQEHEGCIRFIWKGKVPKSYHTGGHVEVPMDIPGEPGATDIWIIEDSIAPEAVPA
jgi:hypothetical protein